VVDKHKAVVKKNTKFIHRVFVSVLWGSIDDGDDDDDDDDDGCDVAVHNGNMVVAVAVVGVDDKIKEDMAGFILNFLWSISCRASFTVWRYIHSRLQYLFH